MALPEYVREEMPSRFERLAAEFHLAYNEFLSNVRDRDSRAAGESYSKLCALFMGIQNKGLASRNLAVLESMMADAESIAPNCSLISKAHKANKKV